MDELINPSSMTYICSLIHKKCHPRSYHGDVNYHTTLNIIVSVAYLTGLDTYLFELGPHHYYQGKGGSMKNMTTISLEFIHLKCVHVD